MGFVQTLNVDSFAFDAQYNTHLQAQQERQREEQTRRGDGRKVSGKSATTTTTSVCVRAHRQVFFWLFFATVLLLGFQKKIFWSFGGEKRKASPSFDHTLFETRARGTNDHARTKEKAKDDDRDDERGVLSFLLFFVFFFSCFSLFSRREE